MAWPTNSGPGHQPSRGDIWLVDPDVVKGSEQMNRRPFLILSDDIINRSAADLVIGVPLTTRHRPELASIRVEISPPEGGLTKTSYAMTEQVRVITKDRLLRRFGRVKAGTLARVADRVKIILGLL